MPQDLAALNMVTLEQGMLSCIPLLVEPIIGSEDSCLLYIGIGVQLREYWIPAGPQRHCPGTAVPVVIIMSCKHHRWRPSSPLAVPRMII
jgi:hypothetical protein